MLFCCIKHRILKLRRPCLSANSQLSSAPPQYSESGIDVVSEHDCQALIAAEDDIGMLATQAALPTYQEAMLSHHSSGSTSSFMDQVRTASARMDNRNGHENRLRRPANTEGISPVRGRDTISMDARCRGSIVTTASSANRDTQSMAFGSVETVNVSDVTSTTVTVDTYDSMASNPSIANSHRAAAGSLDLSSTNGSLSSEGMIRSAYMHL